MHQKKGKPFNPIFVLFIPVIFIFDVIYYLYTRSTCFQCGNIEEFIKSSSLTFYIVSQFVQQIKKFHA